MTANTSTPDSDRPIAIRAARFLDVTTGRYEPNQVVIIEGDRVKAIGTSVPPDARVIDLGDETERGGKIVFGLARETDDKIGAKRKIGPRRLEAHSGCRPADTGAGGRSLF